MTTKKLIEVWRDVEDKYKGLYKISNMGRVKSFHRIKPYIMIPKVTIGYGYVGFSKNGKTVNKSISHLVATAFIPNPNNYPFVCHKDDNPSNNVPSNLFWETPAMNMIDKVNKRRQAFVRGENHGKAKFTEGQVRRMRLMAEINPKLHHRKIGEMFGTTRDYVQAILKRKTWKHI